MGSLDLAAVMPGGRRPLVAAIACAVVAFLGGVLAATVLDAPTPVGVLVGAVLLVWLAGPLVLYLDLARTRRHVDWEPRVRYWLGAWALPPVNILAGVGYLYRRRVLVEGDTAAAGVVLGGNDAGAPWHRYAASVFVYYLFVAVGLAAVVGRPDWLTLGLVASLAWLPFGLAFAPLAYLDLRTLPDRGIDWGPTRYLYLSSAVSPSAAFWYLLRRAWKVSRAPEGCRDG